MLISLLTPPCSVLIVSAVLGLVAFDQCVCVLASVCVLVGVSVSQCSAEV